MAKMKKPQLHGWVYDLHNGIIQPLLELAPNSDLDAPIYKYDNLGD